MTRAETAGTETRTAKADAMEFLRAALVGAPVPVVIPSFTLAGGQRHLSPLRAAIAETVADPADIDGELQQLFAAMAE